MSYLTKKNLGQQFLASKWTEYPAYGKQWRDNWDATFGSSPKQSQEEPEEQESPPPPPGSNAAIEMGCICPVLDNHHGQGSDWGPNTFVYTSGCPVHRYDSRDILPSKT